MYTFSSHPQPTARQLIKATLLAATTASALLITVVLPAEYNIDPTGIGSRLGLDVLRSTDVPTQAVAVTAIAEAGTSRTDNASEAQKAEAIFGITKGQSFNTAAVARGNATLRRDALELTLQPGKGSEVKSRLKTGDSFVFHWTANGEVAVDMHGENPQSTDGGFTSYWVGGGQREASGTLVAPFDGTHGWYWLNQGTQPVTVQIEVIGFQQNLYFPGQK
jgi:hypothetical protein